MKVTYPHLCGLFLIFFFLVNSNLYSQEIPDSPLDASAIPYDIGENSQTVKFEINPADTAGLSLKAASSPGDATMAEGTVSASAGGSDYTVTMSWSGYSNPCFIATSHSYAYTYGWYSGAREATVGSGSSPSSGSVTSYPGPGLETTFTFQYCYEGVACSDCYATKTVSATTANLKSPTNFVASDYSSDAYVYLSWSKGTNIPDYHPVNGNRIVRYYIFKNGSYIGSTNGLSYTAVTVPGETATWSVATNTNYVWSSLTSAQVNNSGSTSAFRVPAGLYATDETYIGEIRLSWTRTSDFATHHRIYRDGALIATVNASQTSYTDTDIVNGRQYVYDVRSYNINYDYETSGSYDYGSTFPMYPAASDGKYNNRVRIGWRNVSDFADEVHLQRDGEEIENVGATTTTTFDYDAIPGKLAQYSIIPVNSGTELGAARDYGFIRPNGKIEGKVLTRSRAGVPGVAVTVTPTNPDTTRSLSFSGGNDYVISYPVAVFPDTAITVSFWMKSNDNVNTGTPFSYASSVSDNSFLIYDYNNFQILINGVASPATGISANDGNWHHIAVTWRSTTGEMRLLKDGVPVYSGAIAAGTSMAQQGSLVLGQDQDRIGGNFQDTQAFIGKMDEVRIYNYVRSDSMIQSDMHKILEGNEAGLVTYYNFDDVTRSALNVAGDYSHAGGNHGLMYGVARSSQSPDVSLTEYTDPTGFYSIRNIYYNEERDFRVTVAKPGHGFSPDRVTRSLDLNSPGATGVDFTDTTSFTIKGRIVQVFAGDTVNIPGAELWVNDQFLGVKTDANGRYALSIEEPGTYTITPHYEDHHFATPEVTLVVEDDIFDVDFVDTEMDTLSGHMLAGCNLYIGQAQFRVTNKSNPASVIDTTITSDNITGYFEVILPSREYQVEMTSFTPLDPTSVIPQDVVSFFDPRNVDLTLESSVQDFIYRKPPQIRITGLPDFGCGMFNVPIMEQGSTYNLRIEVFESFDTDTCLVDTGFVVIYDGIGADPSKPDTLILDRGMVTYEMAAGFPNILGGGSHPFQKSFQIIADVEGQTADSVQWVLVQGNRPRSSTFISTSPEVPFEILRDPPGDASYSYLEESTTFNTAMRVSAALSTSLNAWGEVKVGAKFLSGFGVYVPSEFWGTIKSSLEVGAKVLAQSELGLSFTTTSRFATSGNQDITGTEGDIFVGAAMNLIYSLTDVITYDADSCKVDESTSIIIDNDGFATTFIYTEDHIRNVLIPQLAQLRDIYLASGSDSAMIYTRQIGIWDQTLHLNDSLKTAATFIENRSFSAGSEFESSTSTTASLSASLEFEMYIENEIAVAAGLEVGGNGISGGVTTKWRMEFGAALSAGFSTTRTTGYVLNDDDPGDFFSLDLKEDNVYGTPVFELVSGRSSCPWEPGTQPRDGVQMQIDPFIQSGVDPDEFATFNLFLGNTSQSDETRTYQLSVVQSTNFDGAIIRVGGVVIEDYLSYTIPAGQQLTATMAVERGPLAYNYPDMKLRFYAGCDPQIADTINFSVNYLSPCSEVNLFRPLNNWLVNQASHDTLQVIIRDYSLANPNLQSIGLEYRKLGNEWNSVFTIDRADLNGDFIIYDWDVSALANGDYELRAVSRCGSIGYNYSNISSGSIDRNSMLVFGTPQPADGVLNMGENISVSFTNPLDCGRVGTDAVIRLTDLSDNSNIPVTTACSDNQLILTPTVDLAAYEGHTLRAYVSKIFDLSGNALAGNVQWDFTVNRNPVYWANSAVFETTYKGSTKEFDVTLVNQDGAQAHDFTIEGAAAWLQPNLSSGSIPAAGSRDITFTISDQLNNGSYLDTVYAVTSRGSEPVYVDLTVLSTPPQWVVTASSYQYSMSIIAEVALPNGTFASDDFDLISVYSGDEVRGVANFQFVPEIGGHLAFITVYSNNVSGEPLNFRYWNSGEDTEYGNAQESLVFNSNSATGSLLDPLTIHPTGVAQTIALEAGWNWFSLNVAGADGSLNSILSQVEDPAGVLVKGQTSFSQYLPSKGWLGTLDSLKSGHSYMIQVPGNSSIWHAGSRVNPLLNRVILGTGWNWLGYFLSGPLPVDSALNGYAASNGDRIKSQQQFAEFDAASGKWIGSLTTMEPGEGYLLKSANGGLLTYPGSGSAKALPPIAADISQGLENAPGWQVNPRNYEYSMNMIGVLQINGRESLDSLDILAAFVNDTCRGVVSPVYLDSENRWQAFLIIYSNRTSGENVTFKIYDNSTESVFDVNASQAFTADQLAGSVDQPFEFKVIDLLPPDVSTYFHFSSEASLAKYLRLFIASDEPLAQPPRVEVRNGTTTQNLSAAVFSSEENIYVLDYTAGAAGTVDFIISSSDWSGNSAVDSTNLDIRIIDPAQTSVFALEDGISIKVPSGTFSDKTYFFTERSLIGEEIVTPAGLTLLSDLYHVKTSRRPQSGMELRFSSIPAEYDEDAARKIGFYRYDDQSGNWTRLPGTLTRGSISGEISEAGNFAVFFDPDFIAIPAQFRLSQNYPNPFNPETTIKYDLPNDQRVQLVIYNVLGQRIRTLVASPVKAGYHRVVWDGRDEHGNNVPSGVYFYSFRAGEYSANKKMVLLR